MSPIFEWSQTCSITTAWNWSSGNDKEGPLKWWTAIWEEHVWGGKSKYWWHPPYFIRKLWQPGRNQISFPIEITLQSAYKIRSRNTILPTPMKSRTRSLAPLFRSSMVHPDVSSFHLVSLHFTFSRQKTLTGWRSQLGTELRFLLLFQLEVARTLCITLRRLGVGDSAVEVENIGAGILNKLRCDFSLDFISNVEFL